MFDEMVIYIEACESGSMFPLLADDGKTYAMTASNSELSSWAANCGPLATAEGHNIGACLGDVFSLNWMANAEANDMFGYDLESQYDKIVSNTRMK